MPQPAQSPALTVLITGGAGGIGQAVGLALAQRGHSVYAADAAYSEHSESQHGIITIPLDVSQLKSIESLRLRIVEDTHGAGPDVLINGAGYSYPGPIELVPIKEWKRLFDVNLLGLIAMTQAFAPLMKDRPAGRAKIINISSLVGRLPHPMSAAYCASKHALVAVNEAMRCELAPFGIRVVLIEPGPIRTPFFKRMRENLSELQSTASGDPAAYWYEHAMKKAQAVFEHYSQAAPGPEVVAECVVRAVHTRRPEAHYMVPRINMLRLLGYRLLPTAISDRIMRRLFWLHV